MEAARVAAIRGHEVTLYEKRKLGGTMHEAGFSEDLKSDIRILIDYYAGQMKKNGIRVIEAEATAEELLAGHFDAFVVATGAKPVITKYEKQEDLQVHSIYDYCRDPKSFDLGDRIVIAGGCFMNLEVAQSLLRAGKQVTVTSRRGGGMMGVMEIGDDNSSPQQQRLMILNAQKGIRYQLAKDVAGVSKEGVTLRDLRTKKEELIPCDSLLICRGYRGTPEIYDTLRGLDKEVYAVGDCTMKLRCNEKRNIGDAILEGWQVGNRI